MHGTITAFDASTGHGQLVCTASQKQFDFCNPGPYGEAMRRGDSVVFEPLEKGLVQGAVLVGRRSAMKPVVPAPATSASLGMQFSGKDPGAHHGFSPARGNDRDTCTCCGKLMTPTLALADGEPVRSFCPFCGEVHRDFTRPARPASLGLKDYAAEGLFSAAITAVFTGFL